MLKIGGNIKLKMEYKECIHCKKVLSLNDFQTRKRFTNADKQSFEIEVLGKCRDCERERIYKWKCDKLGMKPKTVNLVKNIEFKMCTVCGINKEKSAFGTRSKKLGIFIKSNCRQCEMVNMRNKRKNDGSLERNYLKCKNCKDCAKCIGGYRNCLDCINCTECKIYKSIRKNVSNRISKAVKNHKSLKSDKTMKLTGCSLNELINWLEYQFDSHMNWENYGTYWHIDHVSPVASFKLSDKQSQQRCFYWENLQPLKASSNIKKSSKIITHAILMQELKVLIYSTKLKIT